MPRQRLSMRQVYDVLRLKWGAGLSDRQIAQSLGLSRPTVANYIQRAQAAGLYWPLPDGLDEAALEARLFPPPTPKGALVQGWSCDTTLLPTGPWCTKNSNAKASPCRCFGKNTRHKPPMASSIAGFVRPIALGPPSSTWSCARAIGPAKSSLSTMPATPCPSLTRKAVRCTRLRFFSPCSAPPTRGCRRYWTVMAHVTLLS